jgi:carbon-monoxide dehydrogenase medium subunit
MAQVEFVTPRSLSEAVEVLDRYGAEARCLAGGTDLVIGMRHGRVTPRYVVNVKEVPELQRVYWDTSSGPPHDLVIGAGVPVARLAARPEVRAGCRALGEAIDVLGAYPLRTRATLGGNIANASPAGDTLPALLVMDALVELVGAAGIRHVPLAEFFLGPGRSVLQVGELIATIRLPGKAMGTPSRYLRIGRRRAMELAIVGVAVRRLAATEIAVAFASVAPTPLRARTSELAFAQGGIDAAVNAAVAEVAPIDDARASRAYRLHLVQVLLRRALEDLQVVAQEPARA